MRETEASKRETRAKALCLSGEVQTQEVAGLLDIWGGQRSDLDSGIRSESLENRFKQTDK